MSIVFSHLLLTPQTRVTFHEKNDCTNHTQLCAQGEEKGQFEQYKTNCQILYLLRRQKLELLTKSYLFT